MKIIIRQPLSFSEIGRKDNQEDCVFPPKTELNKQCNFFVLCDGMGGHDNGEVASATVCNALGEYFKSNIPVDGVITSDFFKSALEYAYNELDKKDNGSLKKMGTTMTCLYLHSKGYLVAHIGDSRIYHIRPNTGVLYQSSDHSLVNDLLRAGELTEEEALNFPQKNVITRAMQPNQGRRSKADIFSFSDVKSGDYFFLCSDGVLEQLTNGSLVEVLSDTSMSDVEKLDSIHKICYGKTKDNYTCYLIPVDKVVGEVEEGNQNEDCMIAGVVMDESVSNAAIVLKKKLPVLKWILIGLCVLASIAYAILNWTSKKDDKPNDEIEIPKDAGILDTIRQEYKIIEIADSLRVEKKDTIIQLYKLIDNNEE